MKVGYIRVSSEADLQSTLIQREALLSAGVDERHIFEDKTSALSSKRPGLEKALEFLRSGDEVVVWKLDRLARDLSHLIAIGNELRERKIGMVSLTENIDTSMPHGQLFFNIFAALAQFEVSLIRERIREGLAAAKKRGSKFGRPRAISDEKLAIILEAIQKGESKASICRMLDIKQTTFFDALRRHKETTIMTTDKIEKTNITLSSSDEGVYVYE